MTYLALKYLHLVGASVLFGTGMGIAFFAWFGYRRALRDDNLGLLQGVLSLTVTADTVFTAVAAAVQPVTGALLWHLAGGSWTSPWIAWVAAVYVFVGVCWLPVVALQIRLRNAARAATSIAGLDPRFHRWFGIWFALGWPAFAGVLVLFALMLGRGWLA
ncbi:DUF2269 domain-containing protein [Ramlibacter sp. AW1]|uniref:DUF2269 domain-containing protein n=1 Tax=Ramlibacter aurantiacus TaxID=2801330 RepID=A0A936ZGF8_9BURK|nr:DUF2269 domain-containing protein [Ramlibacter aurantiacus]MBL0420999.1 DUF2269 domain-containing protein [Ramlibacter aurantiacus]